MMVDDVFGAQVARANAQVIQNALKERNEIDQTTQTDIEIGTAAASAGSVYADLNSGLKALVDDGKRLTGFAFDVVAEPLQGIGRHEHGKQLVAPLPYLRPDSFEGLVEAKVGKRSLPRFGMQIDRID